MIQRDTAPALTPLFEPNLLPYQQFTLDNGVTVAYIHDPSQEVFKIDAVFEAGIYYQPRPLVASTAINMLNEGTTRHTAEEIADLFDFYGAYTDFNCGFNKSELSLISLTKYAAQTIGMLAELLLDSIVPENELDIFLTNKRQEFLVNREKTSYMARKKFSEVFFGSSHPYSNIVRDSDFLNVTPEEVRDFYRRHINARNCRIMICGNVNREVLQTVSGQFGQLPVPPSPVTDPTRPFSPEQTGRYHVTKSNAMQTSIRIGKSGIRLLEEDYAGYMLLNTILGGYFGSRLMSNIREEKGYTYGINSFNVSMPQGSYWCIAADVNNEYADSTVEETFKEIERLKQQAVGNEEMNLVKNFLHGELLRELDGVFSQSDALKHKLNYSTDNRIYIDLIHRIKRCTADELLRLANKYWNTEEMYIVTAGK